MPPRTRPLKANDPRTLTLAGGRLVVRRGPDRGRAVRLEQEETVVGSGPSATLRLTDPTVSRSHFALRVTPDGYLITDLESTNGTFLDSRRIVSAYAVPGDRIDIGATRLVLEAERQNISLALSPSESFGGLIGRSVAMRRVFALLEQVAAHDTTVLLTGETGVGKDLCAQAIHDASPRANGPFVVFDCSAVSSGLMESDLFGHEKGAFTGAHARRVGAFVEASGGTLFLDEVGELPRELQVKLLGVLERREVRPLGATRSTAVDVRVVAATHRDLKLDVNRGAFREDLFHRLNVVTIRVPPLRERPDDIPLLAEHFWRDFHQDPQASIPHALLTELIAHDWPGNIRELRNRIEREATLESPAEADGERPRRYKHAKAAVVEAFERAFFSELLARTNGNVSEAARQAGMDRVYLFKLLRKHRIGS